MLNVERDGDALYLRKSQADVEAIKSELDKLEPPREDEIKSKLVSFHDVLDSLSNDKFSATEKNILLKSIIKQIDYSNHNDTVILDVYFE